MREFIVVTLLCAIAMIVADRVWFDGKLSGSILPVVLSRH